MAPRRQQPFYNSLYDSIHADPDYDSKRGQLHGSRPSSSTTSAPSSQPTQNRASVERWREEVRTPSDMSPGNRFSQPNTRADQGPTILNDTQKRRLSADEDPELSAFPSTNEFLSLTTDEKMRVMNASRKRQRLADGLRTAPQPQAIGSSDDGFVSVSELRRARKAAQSRGTSILNVPHTQAIGLLAAGSVSTAELKRGPTATQSRSTSVLNMPQTQATGLPAAGSVSIAELRRIQKARQVVGKALGQSRGGPQPPLIQPRNPHRTESLPDAFIERLKARTEGTGAVRPSEPRSANILTPETTTSSSDVKVSQEEAMRDALKVDFCEGNALTRWIWEELGKDLEASKPLMLDSFRRTGLPLRKFTFAALRQIVVMLDMVVLPSNFRRKLAEVHAVLESHQHEPLLNIDLKQQLSDIYSTIDTTHTFGVQVLLPKKDDPRVKMATEERKRALVQKAVEVSEKLQSICENIEGYEWSFVNSYSAILKIYSQKYNIRGHELYQRTLDNFSSLAECVGPISQCNALAAIERLATIEATVMALDPHCPDVHAILSIVEQYVDGRLSEVEAVQRSLFNKLVYAIIPFYLFEIDGETVYQFVHGTAQNLGLYTVGREFWSDAISDIRSMMHPVTITDDEIFNILSNYMVGKARISLPPLPKQAQEVPVHNNAQRASNSPVQPHAKPLPPDPADIEFSKLSIDEPVVLEVAPEDPIARPNSASGFPNGYHTKVSDGTEGWTQKGHRLRGRSKSVNYTQVIGDSNDGRHDD
jgi:hypothetical protein